MFDSPPHHKNLIPIRFYLPFCIKLSSLSLILFFWLLLFIITTTQASCQKNPILENPKQQSMKIHPLPKKRSNITIQLERNPQVISLNRSNSSNKKLRRLPHIFNRVLELPFRSDTEVEVEESRDCFRFKAEAENITGGDVQTHTIEIHPGITKIVVRTNGQVEISTLDELELDMWRFRLPETTLPELASAVLVNGELIVTVPKGESDEEAFRRMGNNNNNNNNNGNTNNNRLVLVQ